MKNIVNESCVFDQNKEFLPVNFQFSIIHREE
jgi:hypothetical protein